MNFLRGSIIACIVFLSSVVVSAETSTEIATTYTSVQLTGKATKVVEPDTTHITLQLQHTGRTKEGVQADLNNKMRQILDSVPNAPSVEISTGGYHVYEGEDQNKRRRENWEASQYVNLKGTNKDHIEKIAQHLQGKGLIIQGTRHSVSDEFAKSFNRKLRNDAIEDIKVQAREVAAALGKQKIHISSLRFSGGSNFGPHLRAMSAERAQGGAPVLEPSQQEVTVHVTAEILLK